MSRGGRLGDWLLGGADLPLDELVSRPRVLVRRLVLAEVLARPPALRSPGERSPLSPVGDRG